ncbi:MAG: hypothetical protein PVI86_00315 [Phycisphaerae bacterium]
MLGIVVLIAAMVVPAFLGEMKGDALVRSAKQFRSLIAITRANAQFEGKRYRIRFPNEDEEDQFGTQRQPLVEREEDPVNDPEIFTLVEDTWSLGRIFLEDVRCAEVRLGRPTIEQIQNLRRQGRKDIEEELEQAFGEQDLDPERPPLLIEPDGTSEWVTFVLTTAPEDIEVDALEDYPQMDVIVDGPMGLAWLQRPFYDEELDLFEEKNWPAVLRQDFLATRVLTEDDVLEIRETQLKGRRVELKGQELEVDESAGDLPVEP